MTQEQVAAAMDWSSSKVARIESGGVSVQGTDVKALGQLYQLPRARMADLLEWSQAARQRSWWHEFRDMIPFGYLEYIGHESEAVELYFFNPCLVPGLFQTSEYSQATLRAFDQLASRGPDPDPNSNETMRRGHDLRMNRQRRVFGAVDSPQIRVILDESSLYRNVGSGEMMCKQLLWLAELSRRPNVDIRVLPFDAELIGFYSAFVVLKFGAEDPEVVYTESGSLGISQMIADRVTAVALYVSTFEKLWAVCLNRARTNHLLHHLADFYQAGRAVRPWL